MHLCWKYTYGARCSSQVVRRGRRWATEASCARRTPNTELVTCGRHPPLLSLCNLQYCTSPADFHWFSVSNHLMSHQVISHQTRPYYNLEKKAKSTKIGCAVVNPLLFCCLWPSSPHRLKSQNFPQPWLSMFLLFLNLSPCDWRQVIYTDDVLRIMMGLLSV